MCWPCFYLHSHSWRVSLCDRQPSLCGLLLHRVLLRSLHHNFAGLCANLCGPEEAQKTCQHKAKAATLSSCRPWCGHFAEGERWGCLPDFKALTFIASVWQRLSYTLMRPQLLICLCLQNILAWCLNQHLALHMRSKTQKCEIIRKNFLYFSLSFKKFISS